MRQQPKTAYKLIAKLSLTILTLIAVSLPQSQAMLGEKCLALALSGGANKGAYEAGVLHGLAHLLNETETQYDVVTGVSTGALNGGGISVWPKEKPREMSEWLVETWSNMTAAWLFNEWPLGFT